MAKGFSGAVIGGPMAGKFYEGRTGRWRVDQLPARLTVFGRDGQPEAQQIERQTIEYVYGEPFGVGMWFPSGWTQDQVMEEIIRNYRPSVVERESVMTY